METVQVGVTVVAMAEGCVRSLEEIVWDWVSRVARVGAVGGKRRLNEEKREWWCTRKDMYV